jgi:uncharacterized membrane protein YphA (DoxX/SURF4 family)
MKNIKYLLQLGISAVVLNVWFVRFSQSTIYRGGTASNMIEEFEVYGLNETMVYVVGSLKVLAALGLLIGIFYEKIILPSAGLMAVLMLGAIAMHFKVEDQAIKYLPAGLLFASSLLLISLQRKVKPN